MTHILLITCPDETGLISRISTSIYKRNLNIIVMREFVDPETQHFFMRCEIAGVADFKRLQEEIASFLPIGAQIRIQSQRKKNLVILATREYHVLSDLLARHHFGEIQAHIQAVVSNHDFLEGYVAKFDVPYYFVPHEGRSKEDFENELLETIGLYQPDSLVLAKFMRVLSPGFVSVYENRILNIHHSFLPAFAGANPYRQAYERGVKLIGATAHFVNNQLDEGPIISQKVIQVDHTFSVKNMVQAGHEVERAVLIEALNLVLEDRVFVSGNKTIVFA